MPSTGFTVIIPARLASTRLPNKPLADLAGLPMVVRVARQAQTSAAHRVVVAADSEAIAAACRAHGVEVVLTRTDHATGTDRLAEAAQALGLGAQEVVVNLQGDEPLVPPAVIDAVAARLSAQPDCAMSTAAHRLHDAAEFFNPNVVKVVLDAAGRALYFSRAPIPWARDDFRAAASVLPPDLPALRHVGLYAYRAQFLTAFPTMARAPIERWESLEQLRGMWHGYRIAVLELAQPLPPGVDTPEDLAQVRSLLASR